MKLRISSERSSLRFSARTASIILGAVVAATLSSLPIDAQAMAPARRHATPGLSTPLSHTRKHFLRPVVSDPGQGPVTTHPVQVPVVSDPGQAQGKGISGGPASGFYINSDGSPLLPLIRAATHQLDIEIYTMGDAEVRNAIRDALRRRVRVRIVQDPSPVGAACDVFGLRGTTANASADCSDSQSLVTEVKASGNIYVPFQKSELCANSGGRCFEHGKIVVADGASALVSTGNFDATNLCDAAASPSRCNRDYSVITNDTDVVSTLEVVFQKDLAGVRYDVGAQISPKAATKMTVSPLSLEPLVKFLESAQTSITLQNQYLQEPTLNAAIIAAAKRGVQVSVEVASACAFGKPKPTAQTQWTQTYGAFDQAGIKVRAFTKQIRIDGKPGYLHAKAILVDGVRAWVGSVNGSTTSTSNNREYGLFLTGQSDVAKLADQMNRDIADPAAETWQESLQCARD